MTDFGQSQQANSEGRFPRIRTLRGLRCKSRRWSNINKGVVGFTNNGLAADSITLDEGSNYCPWNTVEFYGSPTFSSAQGLPRRIRSALRTGSHRGRFGPHGHLAQNTGSGDAFDVKLGDAVPAGLRCTGLLAGLESDGPARGRNSITLGTDYTATLVGNQIASQHCSMITLAATLGKTPSQALLVGGSTLRQMRRSLTVRFRRHHLRSGPGSRVADWFDHYEYGVTNELCQYPGRARLCSDPDY